MCTSPICSYNHALRIKFSQYLGTLTLLSGFQDVFALFNLLPISSGGWRLEVNPFSNYFLPRPLNFNRFQVEEQAERGGDVHRALVGGGSDLLCNEGCPPNHLGLPKPGPHHSPTTEIPFVLPTRTAGKGVSQNCICGTPMTPIIRKLMLKAVWFKAKWHLYPPSFCTTWKLIERSFGCELKFMFK